MLYLISCWLGWWKNLDIWIFQACTIHHHRESAIKLHCKQIMSLPYTNMQTHAPIFDKLPLLHQYNFTKKDHRPMTSDNKMWPSLRTLNVTVSADTNSFLRQRQFPKTVSKSNWHKQLLNIPILHLNSIKMGDFLSTILYFWTKIIPQVTGLKFLILSSMVSAWIQTAQHQLLVSHWFL